jgi:tartrate dehydratase alpha subunit/fumarate hydratase class I-like protein
MERLGKQYADAFYENLVRGVTTVSPDILGMMGKAIAREEAPAARGMLETLIKNATLAKERSVSPREFLVSTSGWAGRWPGSMW